MRWFFIVGPALGGIVGLLIAWHVAMRKREDEPDLVARYRAAWGIPNQAIRRQGDQ